MATEFPIPSSALQGIPDEALRGLPSGIWELLGLEFLAEQKALEEAKRTLAHSLEPTDLPRVGMPQRPPGPTPAEVSHADPGISQRLSVLDFLPINIRPILEGPRAAQAATAQPIPGQRPALGDVGATRLPQPISGDTTARVRTPLPPTLEAPPAMPSRPPIARVAALPQRQPVAESAAEIRRRAPRPSAFNFKTVHTGLDTAKGLLATSEPFRSLVNAKIHGESSGNEKAVGQFGEIGLMQLAGDLLTPTTRKDPTTNLLTGANFLRLLVERYKGDLTKALVAYTAGPGAVDSAVAKRGTGWLGAFSGGLRGHVTEVLRLHRKREAPRYVDRYFRAG